MLKYLFIFCAFFLVPAANAEQTSLPNPQVVIKTSEGDITLRLFRDKSPLTVDNFLAYVDAGFYNGTVFHRVIPNFMIQGGGFLLDMTEKPTNDPDSATAQFFINQRSNLQLDWSPTGDGYTVFGEVILGMNVVDFIATAPTGKMAMMSDVPVEPIIINEIVRAKAL